MVLRTSVAILGLLALLVPAATAVTTSPSPTTSDMDEVDPRKCWKCVPPDDVRKEMEENPQRFERTPEPTEDNQAIAPQPEEDSPLIPPMDLPGPSLAAVTLAVVGLAMLLVRRT